MSPERMRCPARAESIRAPATVAPEEFHPQPGDQEGHGGDAVPAGGEGVAHGRAQQARAARAWVPSSPPKLGGSYRGRRQRARNAARSRRSRRSAGRGGGTPRAACRTTSVFAALRCAACRTTNVLTALRLRGVPGHEPLGDAGGPGPGDREANRGPRPAGKGKSRRRGRPGGRQCPPPPPARADPQRGSLQGTGRRIRQPPPIPGRPGRGHVPTLPARRRAIPHRNAPSAQKMTPSQIYWGSHRKYTCPRATSPRPRMSNSASGFLMAGAANRLRYSPARSSAPPLLQAVTKRHPCFAAGASS